MRARGHAAEGNVWDYFTLLLGCNPKDSSLTDLRVDSNCGDDCKRAIDAAATLLDCMQTAGADATEYTAQIIESVDRTCQIYWRG